jgi:hypothetical protein
MSTEESSNPRPGNPRPALAGEGPAIYELIARTLELVATPAHWTRGHFARDRHSHPVSPTSPRAHRFCVGGALWRAAGERFGFTISVRGDGDSFAPPIALELAYRGVGLALVEHLGTRFHLAVREEDRDDDVLMPTLILRDISGVRIEATTTWIVATNCLNDWRRVRHDDVLAALQTALAAVERGRS